MKKLMSVFLTVILVVSLAGCTAIQNPAEGDFDDYSIIPSTPTSSEPEKAANPLTGVKDLDPEKVNQRPTAVMVNNIITAQGVQAGLADADIVYETYVEGGITRLLAVYKDVSKVGKIGSCRSARYSYVDLAVGMDAIYTHAGLDPNYCAPYLSSNSVDNMNLLANAAAYAARESNGLSSEHTLYTSGDRLAKAQDEMGWRTKLTFGNGEWASFRDEDEPYTPAGGSCGAVSMSMSDDYVTYFDYDPATGYLTRYIRGAAQTDFYSGTATRVKNVFILFSSVYYFSDGKHVQTDLSSGTGYYISNGGYEEINWKKGGMESGFSFTAADGSPLRPNAGSSWVCITDGRSAPVFSPVVTTAE